MNSTSRRNTLLTTIAALVLAGAFGVARADDMAGMKADKGKTEKTAKEPAVDMAAAKAKKGTEKLEVAITEKGFEPDKLEAKKGQPVELVFTRKTDRQQGGHLRHGIEQNPEGPAAEQTGRDQDEVHEGQRSQVYVQHEHVLGDRKGSVNSGMRVTQERR